MDRCATAMETGTSRGAYIYLFHFLPCRIQDVERLIAEMNPGATALYTQPSHGEYTFLRQFWL